MGGVSPVTHDCPDGQMVLAPGFYRMSAAQYHSDPCPVPSLSSSVAKILLRKTPRHAFHAHPRLTPPTEAKVSTAAMRLGTAVHKLVLGAGATLAVLPFDDFRSKASMEARAKAIRENKEPVLLKEFDEADRISEQIMAKLAERGSQTLSDGDAELVAIWQEGDVWCRAMFDRCRAGDMHFWIDDLKVSDNITGPSGLGRQVEAMDYHLSAAFYRRAVRVLMGEQFKVVFNFVFAEAGPPNEIIIAQLDGSADEIGRRQVCAAIDVWGRCQKSGIWPGYPKEVARVELPAWATAGWEAREQTDPLLSDVSYG